MRKAHQNNWKAFLRAAHVGAVWVVLQLGLGCLPLRAPFLWLTVACLAEIFELEYEPMLCDTSGL